MNFNFSMKTIAYVLISVVVYIVFLLANIPASYVVSKFFPEMVSSSIKLKNPSGTLWSGEVSQLSVKQVELGNVNWELSVIPLIWGSTNFNFVSRHDSAIIRTQVRLKTKQVAFSETEIDFPLSDLMPLLYGLPLSFDGNLKAHFSEINVVAGQQFLMNGRALLTDVKLIAPQSLSLGNFSIVFEPEVKGTRVTITDNQGPVAVNAIVNIKETGKYLVKATLTPRTSADSDLKNSLALLGKPDSQGRYSFNYNGVLPVKF